MNGVRRHSAGRRLREWESSDGLYFIAVFLGRKGE
jgi:hypothetical protein